MALEFIKCKGCGKPQRSDRTICSSCGTNILTGKIVPVKNDELEQFASTGAQETEPLDVQRSTEVERKQLLGLTGSIILFLGVFAPILSLPIVGTVNYVMNGKGDGIIVMVLAAVSFVLVRMKEYRPLWATGLCSLGLIGFSFITFQVQISRLKSLTDESLAGNPFRFLADIAMGSIQLQWGWAILITGAGLIIAAAAMHGSIKMVPFGFKSRAAVICTGTLAVVVVWILSVLSLRSGPLSPSYSSKLSQSLGKAPKAKDSLTSPTRSLKEPGAKVRDQIIEVRLLRKNFTEQDYQELIVFDIEYRAPGLDKPARAIKGALNLNDLFGDTQARIGWTIDNPIKAGTTLVKNGMAFKYNQFFDQHQWVRATDLSNMTATFTVSSILYDDGSRRDFE